MWNRWNRWISVLLSFALVLSLLPALAVPGKAYSISDWMLAANAPVDAEVVERQWRYTKTSYVDSKEASLAGYTLVSSEWVQSGTGSVNYASFPSGFDTSHSIYTSFKKSNPYGSSYENTTTRRTVTTGWAGYVYWHWMYDTNKSNGTSQRAIYNKKGTGPDNNYYYKYFGAFTSTKGNYRSDKYYCNSTNIVNYIIPERTAYADCQGATRWFRFDYYKASYVDYDKLFHYSKTEELTTNTEITSSSSASVRIDNVREYVKYKDNFVIHYDANGGSGAPADQTKRVGTDLKLSTQTPVRSGYEFLGWSVSASALDGSYKPGDLFKSNQDYTLYAIWKNKTQYMVSYDSAANGGSDDLQRTAVYQDEQADLTKTAHKAGWTHVGWNTDPNATEGLSSCKVTGNVTLYAIFSRTVTANLYVGEASKFDSETKTYYNNTDGAEIALPQIPAYGTWKPVCWVSGDGWEYWPGDTAKVKADTLFYAKYRKELTLSYDANGGDSTPESQTVALYYRADGKYEESQPVLADAITRSGYHFDKWAKGSVDGPAYAAGDSLYVDEDTVLYATWTSLPSLDAPVIAITDVPGGKTAVLTAQSGADIYYTLDGCSPGPEAARYTGPISLTDAGEITLKAMARAENYTDSAVSMAVITLMAAKAPEADVKGGIVHEQTRITLGAEADAEICYTLDGSDPTPQSPVYSQPLAVSESLTLKAVAVRSGYAVSDCAVYSYTVLPVYTTDTFGYSFGNAAKSFGYTDTQPNLRNYCIPYSSVELLFGPSVKGKSVYVSMARNRWTGNCCGMASTSALMYYPGSGTSAASFGQQNTHALSIQDTAAAYGNLQVRTFIEAMQVSQKTEQFAEAYNRNMRYNEDLKNGKDLEDLREMVSRHLAEGKNDLIAVLQRQMGGHALLAYALEPASQDEYHLYVYDCNYPNDNDRYITLRRDASGALTEWSYEIGFSYGTWGTGTDGSKISYVPYDTIQEIWNRRGKLYDDRLTLTVDSDNVSVYDLRGEEIGQFTDGRFHTARSDVYEVPEINLGAEQTSRSVYLPEDYYILENKNGGQLSASVVGDTLGASVSTDASNICFGMNEALSVNEVSIENAGTDTQFTISLDSSKKTGNQETVFKNVTISGTGNGDTLHLSDTAGSLALSNCNLGSYQIDGVEQLKYTVTASAGVGGRISPSGDVSVSAGTSKTFTIIPEPGYRIKQILVDGVYVGTEDTFTFDSISKGHTIRALFEPSIRLNGLVVDDRTVEVRLMTDEGAILWTALYAANGKMLEARMQRILAGEEQTQVTFRTTPPDGSTVKVLLLSADGRQTPLCRSISAPAR